jgi:beta-lactamase superfamily II metal-dependent hydrolase
MKFKKLFVQILLFICSLFLTSCVQLIPPVNNGGSDNEKEYPYELSLDICSYDFYQLTDDLFKMPINSYDITIDNPMIASISTNGYITTYMEGNANIYFENKINEDYNTILKLNTSKGIKVDYIDVGQGDAILVLLPNDEVMMIDAGAGLYYDEATAWQNIKNTLNKRGVSVIDHLVLTHNHGDHYGLVPNVVRNYRVLNCYDSGSIRTNWQYINVMDSITNAGISKKVVKVGDIIVKEENLLVQVVGVQQSNYEEDDINYQSIMIRIEYEDVAYMFTGDAGYRDGDCENVALNSGLELKSNVLKVGHHGSMYSSGNKFLNAVKPDIAIITTSKDTETGHPHTQALNRLKNVSAEIYQSAIHGTITVSSNGEIIYIVTEKN